MSLRTVDAVKHLETLSAQQVFAPNGIGVELQLYTNPPIKLLLMLSQHVIRRNRPLKSATSVKTADAENHSRTPSALGDTAPNGTGAEPQLYTNQHIKLLLMPSQLA